MFAKSFIALAAVASFAVAAPLEKKGAPAGWAYGYLEDYDTYHTRYLALKCYEQKNTAYFQDCCRPMLSTENLKDNRKAYCTPSSDAKAAAVSSISAKGTASASASADKASETEYVNVEASASSAAPSNAKVAAAYSSASSVVVVASSTYPAAAASSSAAAVEYVAPVQKTTSTTPAWTPAPTTAAPAATTAASNNNGQSFNGGFATYFYQGGNAGACGTVHGDWDMIVAIDHEQWGSSGYGSGSNTCGRWLTVTNTKNGKSVVAMVADVCPTCANGNSLDLSQGAFNAIATEAEGSVPISWHWN